LWAGRGGVAAARELESRLLEHVDVVMGAGHRSFKAAPPGEAQARDMIQELAAAHPRIAVAAATLRTVSSAAVNDWGAVAWSRTNGFVAARTRLGIDVLDRIGAGDSFASGLLYGLLERGDLGYAVELAAAHGALAMTTPGDNSMAALADVEALIGATDQALRR
jgi:2-dehydro-3-deoxygluconokinase